LPGLQHHDDISHWRNGKSGKTSPVNELRNESNVCLGEVALFVNTPKKIPRIPDKRGWSTGPLLNLLKR
tara:strand:+ start:800 stop:1006 length:207 start_codon:yes stop_codon:yes gene_type:complete